jgi:hypothetical protein
MISLITSSTTDPDVNKGMPLIVILGCTIYHHIYPGHLTYLYRFTSNMF